MKCPSCGAANDEKDMYCGACAAQLRAPGPAEHGDILPEEPDLPPQLKKLLDGSFLKHALLAGILLAGLAVIRNLRGDADIPATVVTVSIAVALVVVYIFFARWLKRKGAAIAMRTHILPRHPPLDGAVASARSVPMATIAGFVGVGVLGCAFIGMGLFLATTATNGAWVIAVVMGTAFLALTSLSAFRVKSEVTISREAVQFTVTRPALTIRFSRAHISTLEVRGRFLRIRLSDAPVGMFKQSRHLILGGAAKRDELAQAVRTMGYDPAP